MGQSAKARFSSNDISIYAAATGGIRKIGNSRTLADRLLLVDAKPSAFIFIDMDSRPYEREGWIWIANYISHCGMEDEGDYYAARKNYYNRLISMVPVKRRQVKQSHWWKDYKPSGGKMQVNKGWKRSAVSSIAEKGWVRKDKAGSDCACEQIRDLTTKSLPHERQAKEYGNDQSLWIGTAVFSMKRETETAQANRVKDYIKMISVYHGDLPQGIIPLSGLLKGRYTSPVPGWSQSRNVVPRTVRLLQ